MAKKVLLAVVAFVLALIGMAYFGEDHQRYLAFAAQRDAWHRRCDVYVGKRPAQLTEEQTPLAKACVQELDEMMAHAKRQGWDR